MIIATQSKQTIGDKTFLYNAIILSKILKILLCT